MPNDTDTTAENGKTYSLRPNKSALKRDHLEVQTLAREMLNFSPATLAGYQLNANLLHQIAIARKLKSGARKRQIKHITNLLVDFGMEKIDAHEQHQASQARRSEQIAHRAEFWRDKLLVEGDTAVGALIVEFPSINRQQLRSLLRRSPSQENVENRTTKVNPKYTRALFDFLKNHLETARD